MINHGLNLVMVGAGEAARKHWVPGILGMPGVNVVAVVGHDIEKARQVATMFPRRVSVFHSTWLTVPPPHNLVALILTPDHFPTIESLVRLGYKRLMVEKPLVSRMHEIPLLRALMAAHPEVRIFAVDQYIAKAIAIRFATSSFEDDPRNELIERDCTTLDLCEMRRALGRMEGITVNVVEAGKYGIPDLRQREWLWRNLELGGMGLDLGTHVFAPILSAWPGSTVAHVLTADMYGLSGLEKPGLEPRLVRIKDEHEVEMFVSALLSWVGPKGESVLFTANFGKVPGEGGNWGLMLRFEGGVVYDSFRSDQPGSTIVEMTNGDRFCFRLKVSPIAYLLEGAQMYFAGELPGFDGNVAAILQSLEVARMIHKKYFAELRP